jgi:hypothetical protein
MSALDQIVNIVITQQTAAVQQPSFSIPLIVGPNAPSTLTYFTSAASMLQGGYVTSDIEYVYASVMMEQALTPTLFGVGQRTVAVAQVDTIAVSTLIGTGHTYVFTINGHLLSYLSSSDTQQSILTALNTQLAAITPTPPGVGVVTGTGSGALLTITGASPGLGISYTAVDTDLTHVNVTPVNGIANDLNNIVNATGGSNWYGMCLASNQAYDILQAASFIEATGNRIFVASSNDSNIPTSLTTDLASQLKALSYTRTACIYSPGSYNLGIDAGWLGGQLPQTPGASTWDLKTIVGVSPDTFTAGQVTNMIGVPGVGTGKNVNIYQTVGGVNITQSGIMAGGQYIDITIFIDWLRVTMQTNIFALLVNNPKIPYTDKGLTVVENAVRQTLVQGSDNGGTGGVDYSSIVVNAVPVASIPSNDRAMRYVPAGSVAWSCRLTGAMQNIVVNGVVSV